MKMIRASLVVFLLTFLGSPFVFACRFNVRDVGFVDLENQPYLLLFYIDNNTPKNIVDEFNALAAKELKDTNISPLVINVDETPDHPAIAHLKGDRTFPTFVLMSYDNRSLTLGTIETGANFNADLTKLLTALSASTMRNKIIEQVIDTFGVVLVVEGIDTAENNNALAMAGAAISDITKQMNSLPKKIAKPPVLLRLNIEQREAEKIMLWSMGIESGATTAPQVLIFYGRGRRMGAVLRDATLTQKMIRSYLSVIGADCECGLDRSWMQGGMLPAKWGRDRLEILAKQLGFDTEHPLIKIEMSQLVRKGDGTRRSEIVPEIGIGYQEFELPSLDANDKIVEDKKDETDAVTVTDVVTLPDMDKATDKNDVKNDVPPYNTDITPPVEEKTDTTQDEVKLRGPLYVVGIAGVVVLALAVAVVLKRKSGSK